MRLKVQSFEAVAWLPVIGMVTSVLGSLRFKGGKRAEQIEVSLSLSLSLSICISSLSCFRIHRQLPNRSQLTLLSGQPLKLPLSVAV